MALAFDDFGRPFIITKEQEQKTRLRGIHAHKSNISAGKAVARILLTSLGLQVMDRMMQSQDGDVTISLIGDGFGSCGDPTYCRIAGIQNDVVLSPEPNDIVLG